MKEDFYTFGGGHFWEDVFFYQKWRIQRNSITKNYRLLDNWDIRRMSGTFEECRKAFVRYIDAYEITRQKGHIIIMIHGLGQSKNIFKPLWRAVLKEKFLAAAINYPSSQKNADAHIRQFRFLLNHLEDISTVSFVTYGAGNIILQKLMQEKAEWQDRIELGRVVEVCPYIHGSLLMKKISKNKFLSFFTGPMVHDMTPKALTKIKPITRIETGIILSGKPWYEKFLELITFSLTPKLSYNQIKKTTRAKEVIEINCHHHNVFKSHRIQDAIIAFLKEGHF